jgi:DNA-nicking Smr family endonuclease
LAVGDSKQIPEEEPPIIFPIDGVLDLHTFSPREIEPLFDDYLGACLEAGIHDVRIIHGKGKGILRNRVYALLEKHPLVESFVQAPLEAGGWGAVLVKLKPVSADNSDA